MSEYKPRICTFESQTTIKVKEIFKRKLSSMTQRFCVCHFPLKNVFRKITKNGSSNS